MLGDRDAHSRHLAIRKPKLLQENQELKPFSFSYPWLTSTEFQKLSCFVFAKRQRSAELFCARSGCCHARRSLLQLKIWAPAQPCCRLHLCSCRTSQPARSRAHTTSTGSTLCSKHCRAPVQRAKISARRISEASRPPLWQHTGRKARQKPGRSDTEQERESIWPVSQQVRQTNRSQ